MTSLTEQAADTLTLLQQISEQIDALSRRLDTIERLAIDHSKKWLNKHEAAALLNVDETTLALYRRTTEWADGSFGWIDSIHYHKMPIVKSRGTAATRASFEYNRELLMDWQINRLDWAAHQRAIDLWTKKRNLR